MPSASPTQTSTTPHPSASSRPFSISLPNSKSKHPPTQSAPRPLISKKRPHSSLADSDSDDESSSHAPQLVSSFDHSAGGAISVDGNEKSRVPLVIVGQKNRDWRDESRRKRSRNLLPAEVQAARSGQDSLTKDAVEREVAPREFGLNFVTTEVRENDGDVTMVGTHITVEAPQQEATSAKTVDEEAMDALMGNGGKRSTLVLHAIRTDDEVEGAQMERLKGGNEDDSFRSDVASRPDSASLDEYAAVPIEEFGAALLRGMGWKEGDVVGKRKNQTITTRIVERRPALLGIGAKEAPGGVGDELGAWGKSARGKRKVDKTYNPVLLRNSKTGEMLTEEELEAKKEAQKREEADWRERRDRNLAIDEERKNERRDRQLAIEDGTRSRRRESHRERDRDSSRQSTPHRRARSRSTDGSSSRHRSSRRERSRSAERSNRHASSSRREERREPDHERERERDRGPKDYSRTSTRKADHRDDGSANVSWRPSLHRDHHREDSRRRKRLEVLSS
ncbi:Luc7-like protein 3 [Pseudocyphellaria aurata]|nr:Luc7-like protein 3 [Pseudocyphellaria aurata]